MTRRGFIGSVIAVVALAACGGSDYSSTLAQSIRTTGASQLSAAVAVNDAGAVTTVDDANCIETGSTQSYTCIVHYNVSDAASALNQDYRLDVVGACDDSGSCQWHATGPGVPSS